MELLTKLGALRAPAGDERRAVRPEVFGERTDCGFRHTGDIGGPGGGLGAAVLLPHHVGEEAFPAFGVGLQKLVIREIRFFKRVDDPEHQSGVRPRTHRHPGGAELFRGERFHRVNADRADPRVVDQRVVVGACAVRRREPVDIVRDRGIRAPENDPLGGLQHPLKTLRFLIRASNHVRQNFPHRAVRVVVLSLHVAAAAREQPADECHRGLNRARGLPAVGLPENRGRSIGVVDVVDRVRREIECRIPIHLHPFIPAAVRRVPGFLLEERLPHHRMQHPALHIGLGLNRVDIRAREVITGSGRERNAAVIDGGAEYAPVARGGEVIRCWKCHLSEGENQKSKSVNQLR